MLNIQLHLPISWQPQAPAVDNQLFLRVLALLEAQPAHADDEEPEQVRWQALEARLDLCLSLLGRLLARDTVLPAPQAILLSAEQAGWTSSTPLEIGSHGALALYLLPAIPEALWLDAQISACDVCAEGWQIRAEFQLADETLQDWLTKTLFRRHRRQISEQRRFEVTNKADA